jgi:hypothetical protein
VSNSGNVGVGSDNTSPAYLLDASGGAVNCSELRINGVVQTFGGSQTLAQVLTQGNTANTSINMNNNNITGANTITASTFTGGTGGKIVCDPTADTTTIGKYLTPANGSGYTLYTSNLLCDSNITANGYYLTGGVTFKPVEWDWQGSSKASISSSYWVQWDTTLDSLPSMSLTWDWELELRFRNYATTTDYIGILYNGQTAGNTPSNITGYYGHETKQWGGSSASQAFNQQHIFSKVFNRNVDYNEHIYRLRLCWDSRNNVLVNYSKGVCFRFATGTSPTGITDYTTDEGVQVYSNTNYLQETVETGAPSITSIRFQSYNNAYDIFRSATLRIKKVAKRYT